MTIPYWLGVVLGAILFWRITVWLHIEEFMGSWKGFVIILSLMTLIAGVVFLWRELL